VQTTIDIHGKPTPGRPERDPPLVFGVETWIALSRTNFDVRKWLAPSFLFVMGFNREATRCRRSKSQPRDGVWRNVAFDVVAVKMNVHRLIGGDLHYDFVILHDGENRRLWGGLSVVNRELENAAFSRDMQREYP